MSEVTSKEKEQAERRRVLREDHATREARPKQSSNNDQQSSNNDQSTGEAPGGRWAGQGKPKIVQGGPDYPRLPSSSPWASRDPVPDEPLLLWQVPHKHYAFHDHQGLSLEKP
jgi:hypothetical protein